MMKTRCQDCEPDAFEAAFVWAHATEVRNENDGIVTAWWETEAGKTFKATWDTKCRKHGWRVRNVAAAIKQNAELDTEGDE